MDWAAAEAERRGAALRLVHALGSAVEIGYDETGTGLTEQVFEAATKLLAMPGPGSRPRIPGCGPTRPWSVEGRFGLPLGSVAHAVLHHASCPVAIVPVR
ncbi:universal stress protein [Streptomyces sp. MMCC 100]|uniref:universal stress protein n=1 Tax=Streptomyces sp. MMCC 100 TaxID=3163555 RepID=UPI0035A3B31F